MGPLSHQGDNMGSFAVLVDGGFIKRRLGNPQMPFCADDFSLFLRALCKHDALAPHALHRVYFYDAAPLMERRRKPLNGEQIDFGNSDSARRNKSLHQSLARQPFVALRMGELAFRGWSVAQSHLPDKDAVVELRAEHLQPNIQQKGVDMRIGLDIAALTLKKFADIIVLVTADSDFVPAMKFARREGAQLYLVPLGSPLKETMHEHADLIIQSTCDDQGRVLRPAAFCQP